MSARACRVVLLAASVAAAAPAAAQATGPAGARPAGRLEVAAGGGWFTAAALGGAPANLRGRDGSDYQLFATDTRVGAGPLFDARAGFALSRRYAVEARVGWSRPELGTAISADVEGAPSLTVVERVERYVVDGALIVMLDGWRVGGLVPFASAGAGYLRELHEGRTLVEEGVAYHGGGGVKRWLFTRERRVVKSAGIRGDARFYILSGGAAGEATTHLSLTAGVMLAF